MGEAVKDIDPEDLDVASMDEYLRKLDEAGMCLMVYECGSVIFQSQSKGILPQLEAIEALGSRLKGTLMVDKIVGRAAALLILYSGVVEVHAGVVSRGGRDLLRGAGVELFFREETEQTFPFEATVLGINNPELAYEAIVEKMESLKAS